MHVVIQALNSIVTLTFAVFLSYKYFDHSSVVSTIEDRSIFQKESQVTLSFSVNHILINVCVLSKSGEKLMEKVQENG